MSLRGADPNRTICEVLRKINDKLQGTPIHKEILPLLVEAEGMGKRMSKKLVEYNKNVYAGWWAANPKYEEDLKVRMNKTYIAE